MLSPFQKISPRPFHDAVPSPDLINRQVQKILVSGHFDASPRNRRFLEFIVEQTLAGHGDRLKGYTIALEVFDRDPSFDPQLDPVVRIEAGRLRRSLERYYLTEGKTAALTISIPKGKYVPLFEIRSCRGDFDGSPDDLSKIDDRVNLIINPLFDQYTGPEIETFDMALIEEIIMEFHGKHKDIDLIVPSIRPPDLGGGEPATPPNTEYVLHGSIRRSDGGIRIIFHLAEHTTGHLVWTQSFNQDAATVDMIATPREIAAEIAGNVTGVIRRLHPDTLLSSVIDA